MSDIQQQQSSGQEDYVDKGTFPHPTRCVSLVSLRITGHLLGLDAVEKKEIGSDLPRGTNEKITDGVRDAFESATGDNVRRLLSSRYSSPPNFAGDASRNAC